MVYQPMQPQSIQPSILLYSGGCYVGFWRKQLIQAKFSQAIFSYYNLQNLLETMLVHTPGVGNQDVIVTIPSSKLRTLARGGSIVHHFQSFLSKKYHMSCETLQKQKPTQRQAKIIGKSNRYKNVRNTLTAPKALQNKNVLLFDDVCTTGATLKEAIRSIQAQQPASILCITLLRSTLDV